MFSFFDQLFLFFLFIQHCWDALLCTENSPNIQNKSVWQLYGNSLSIRQSNLGKGSHEISQISEALINRAVYY